VAGLDAPAVRFAGAVGRVDALPLRGVAAALLGRRLFACCQEWFFGERSP
jgi:hypothetical protein